MPNIKSIGQGVRGLRLPKFGNVPLTFNAALTTVLRTNVLHCDTDLLHTYNQHCVPSHVSYNNDVHYFAFCRL